MSVQASKGEWLRKSTLLLSCALLPPAFSAGLNAQQHGSAASHAGVNASAPQPVDTATTPASGTLVDQVLAVVNGDLVLESDVSEEQRFTRFEPIRDERDDRDARDQVVERLIDQDLILQQSTLQPDDAVSPAEANEQLKKLRVELPACKPYHCETDAGWAKFVAAQGFTMDELTGLMQRRLEILKFVELRFRSGILIAQAQIKAYYDKSLLPEYAKRNAKAPPLDVLKNRIQEILLQQQVTSLLGDWLKTLKAEGSVRVMRPGEVQP